MTETDIKPHEGDEGRDVGDRQIWHMGKLSDRVVDGSDKGSKGLHRVILEGEELLQVARKKFVCDSGSTEGVKGEDLRPSVSTGEYPGGGYMALELIFVSARTNKRHHHPQVRPVPMLFLNTLTRGPNFSVYP